jgi:hypothetical protein
MDPSSKKLKPRARRGCLMGIITLIGLCLLLSLVSALSNIGLPQPESFDRLPAMDKAHLSEALQLKMELGELIWSGWGSTRQPSLLWNHAYVLQVNPTRMDQAEAEHTLGDQYVSTAEAFQAEFKQELSLMAHALEAGADMQAAAFVRDSWRGGMHAARLTSSIRS